MKSSLIELLVAFGGGALALGVLGYFLKGKLSPGKIADIFKSIGSGAGKIINATAKATGAGGAPAKDTGNQEEIKRREDELINKLKMFILLPFIGLVGELDAHSTPESEALIREEFKIYKEYSSAVEKQMNDIRTNKDNNTVAEVKHITPGNDVKVLISIPTKDVLITKEGIKTKPSTPIIREIIVSNDLANAILYDTFHYDGQILIGGSLLFGDGEIKKQIVLGVEVLTYNTQSLRFSLCPTIGTSGFALGIAVAPNEKLRNIRVITGIGKSFDLNKDDYRAEISIAASLGL